MTLPLMDPIKPDAKIATLAGPPRTYPNSEKARLTGAISLHKSLIFLLNFQNNTENHPTLKFRLLIKAGQLGGFSEMGTPPLIYTDRSL